MTDKFDIHLEFDEEGNVGKMSIVQNSGRKVDILSDQKVGFNTTNPQGKLQVLDCPIGIGDPPESLPKELHIEGDVSVSIMPKGHEPAATLHIKDGGLLTSIGRPSPREGLTIDKHPKEMGIHGIGTPPE